MMARRARRCSDKKKKKMEQPDTPSTEQHAHAASRMPRQALRSGGRFDALRGSAAHQHAQSIGDDILRGADAIAEFIYGSANMRRKVYNLVQQRKLPHFRLGASICARKSVVLEWINRQEEGETSSPSSAT
jgi:hypothetical protein